MKELELARALLRSGVLLLAVVAAVLLVQRAPRLAATVQDWYDALALRWAPLEQLNLFDAVGGASGLTQWLVGLLQQALNVAGLLVSLFALRSTSSSCCSWRCT